MLRCPEHGCDWSKLMFIDQVFSSLRGHYSYQHPERRPPEKRDALAAVEHV